MFDRERERGESERARERKIVRDIRTATLLTRDSQKERRDGERIKKEKR